VGWEATQQPSSQAERAHAEHANARPPPDEPLMPIRTQDVQLAMPPERTPPPLAPSPSGAAHEHARAAPSKPHSKAASKAASKASQANSRASTADKVSVVSSSFDTLNLGLGLGLGLRLGLG